MMMFAVTALALAIPTTSGTTAFDKAMEPVVTQYLPIVQALAADKTDGVTAAARAIEALAARLDAGTVSGRHASHYAALPAKLAAAAKELAGAKDIAAMRKALQSLSKPLAMWATMSKPAGLNVAFCSMYPGSWLQPGAVIANPYYGATMLRCGEIISGPDVGQASGHMKH